MLLLTIETNESKIGSIELCKKMEGNMKSLRKIALIFIMTIMTIMIASAFTTKSYATIESGYLTIKQLRASGYGYKALEKISGKYVNQTVVGQQ